MAATKDKDKANIKADHKWAKELKKLILIMTLKTAKQLNFPVTHVSNGNPEKELPKLSTNMDFTWKSLNQDRYCKISL